MSETLKALVSEIRILPMSIALLIVAFGAVLATGSCINAYTLSLVLLNCFLFLYAAHFNDTFFDMEREKVRFGEPSKHAFLMKLCFSKEAPNVPMAPRNYYLISSIMCILAGSAVMMVMTLMLGWVYAFLALMGLFLALSYSAFLDRVPIVGDNAYGVGVVAALWCGYLSQKFTIDETAVLVAIPCVLLLIGGKCMDSYYDVEVDLQNGKMTIPAFLYSRGMDLVRIRDLAYMLLYCGIAGLFLVLPRIFWPGLSILAAMTIISHLKYRKNDEGIGIVTFCMGVILFLSVSIALVFATGWTP